MDWQLVEYKYQTYEGEHILKWWIGYQESATIKLEALAGQHQSSEPPDYLEDTDGYTQVFVRAIHKGSGAFLWLSEFSEGIQSPVSSLTDILDNLNGYDGEPKKAYQQL